MKTSRLSENLKGSQILEVAGKVRSLLNKGEQIYNLTIGDFDTTIFSTPEALVKAVISQYSAGHTNYPVAIGELSLRKSASDYLKSVSGLEYSEDEILVSAGARPLIYSFYQTIIDPGDKVLYPLPSWNNDAYTFLNRAETIAIQTKAENKFMPTAKELEPHIRDAALVAICSPLNPTGTVFKRVQLEEICDLILEENKNRIQSDRKPLYLLYDSIYWQLTYGETAHLNPVELRPEMRDFTLSIDGISKAFSATGVRVGWAYGPTDIIKKMTALLTHIGAWAPKPEQLAVAEFLNQKEQVKKYLEHHRTELSARLKAFYDGFMALKSEGFSVDAIAPEAALYLSVNLDLKGKKTIDGKLLNSARDITNWLIDDVRVALVPFYAFGTSDDLCWFRLSVGTVKLEDIPLIMNKLKKALSELENQ